MQDQKIGQKCQICQRRDYIPFECKRCKKKLCDQHFWDNEHSCRFEDANKIYQINPIKVKYRCDICQSKLTTINHHYCQKCQKLFCLKHRLPEEHQCKKLKDKQKCQII